MSIATESTVDINVMIVIDTDYVKANYPNPSHDPNQPTAIVHDSQFMISTNQRVIISEQGTTALHLEAKWGDTVSFQGISIYGNSEDAVILYGIKHWSGNHVLGHFLPVLVKRQNAAVPDVNTKNGLPAKSAEGNFIRLGAKVAKSGTGNFHISFALYTLADDGETQKLLGYYCWDPAITVIDSSTEFPSV